jgi:hypothetical protein
MQASPEIQIRRADPQDARAIAKVLYESFAEHIWYSPIYDGEGCPPEAVIEVHSEVNVSKAAGNNGIAFLIRFFLQQNSCRMRI